MTINRSINRQQADLQSGDLLARRTPHLRQRGKLFPNVKGCGYPPRYHGCDHIICLWIFRIQPATSLIMDIFNKVSGMSYYFPSSYIQPGYQPKVSPTSRVLLSVQSLQDVLQIFQPVLLSRKPPNCDVLTGKRRDIFGNELHRRCLLLSHTYQIVVGYLAIFFSCPVVARGYPPRCCEYYSIS
jgi:hypothetical protein